jgi:putative membrane-bound dehydrogenase-like protein
MRPLAAIFGAMALALACGPFTPVSAAPQTKATAREDLARDKPATASSFQSDDKSPLAAFDGNPETRWCAADGSTPQWLQVDLGKPETLTGYRIAWEDSEGTYRSKLEGSSDGQTWTMLDDRTAGREKPQGPAVRFPNEAKGVRYVRLTGTEAEAGKWISLFSLEVYGTREAPQGPVAAARKSASDVLRGIKAPPGFEVTAFAAPPEVRYPTCLAASPTGEVFVGIDENGSLDAKGDRGRVVRCTDTDGDGKADKFNVFASMDSPRGLVWDAGTLYVLHPPDLTAYVDTDGDGKADRSSTLVKGIGFDLKFRGADHTTNGIRLGIDGYLYIAVGDYGFIHAEGLDRKPLQMLGGGVARVKTDGTGLEIVSRGQRNIYDVAIDPRMNLFTRDNTNDGDGWDVRLSHVVPTGHYGYPSLFKRFADEHIQPLADYGGGSPCGSLYLQDCRLPAAFGDMLYTCEWGRGGVFMHPLEAKGAGFSARQEMFLEIPRPTDMDVDGLGRMYVSSWRDGGFNYSRPDVGYVVRVAAQGVQPEPFPDLASADDGRLVGFLGGPTAVLRLAAQRELLRRGVKPEAAKALVNLASSKASALPGRVAAIFTLGLTDNPVAFRYLVLLADSEPEVREFALKALGDHGPTAATVGARAAAKYLDDPDPRVRLQAATALGRFGQADRASALLPLTADADPLVAHVAVKALVALNAGEVCLKGLADPRLANGASLALREMHTPEVVKGLFKAVDRPKDVYAARPALQALCRLYFAESPYEGKWWGTRPDTSGPYYSPTTWEGSEAIGEVLRSIIKQAESTSQRWLLGEMLKNKIDFEETTALALKLSATDPTLMSAATDLLISRPKLSLDAIKFLEKVATTDPDPSNQARATRGLLRHVAQPEAKESALKALALVSEQDNPAADPLGVWLDYTRDVRNSRDPAGLAKLAEGPDPGRGVLGYAVLIQVGENKRVPEASRSEAARVVERAWSRPETTARVLRAVALTKLTAYTPKVKEALGDSRTEVKLAAEFAARRLNLSAPVVATAPTSLKVRPIAATPYEAILAAVLKDPGDATLGATLFEKQGCVNCHAVAKGQPIKGPYLGDITTRYNRTELTESILKPSARIAQGFETKKFALNSGQVYEGFVVREAGDEVEMRNSTGAVTVISKKDIEETLKSEQSVMPQGLLDPLTPHDLASVLAYLESLKGK